ncbi:wall-associated receptor kinase-like 20 [Salvia splendens]|uniref:wall-associated receptor kinase-like 20 n=1 Tax=Salvia splendens TaxID=180675 RepID=UPI001C26F79D|nr:wall-associated receptor kinase-like 20 [Salvia splendens]
MSQEQLESLTWEDFKEELYDKYIPRSYRKAKEAEFYNLKQGRMTVTEYDRALCDMSRYAPEQVNTDEKMSEKFCASLRHEIRMALACRGRLSKCGRDKPLLIYEYVSRGTLFEHLHRAEARQTPPLNLLRRLFIAHQAADGLAYLHSSAVPPIYHRDVKTSNILLDENLDAKVSDFGLSRLVELSERDCTHINTSAQGTLGYLDPEYYVNMQLTDRSDVYSFGVVLLELLTCKRAIDFNRDEENVNLVVYMKRMFDEDNLMAVIDPAIKQGASEVELETMKASGIWLQLAWMNGDRIALR